jgi:hypothetical protein
MKVNTIVKHYNALFYQALKSQKDIFTTTKVACNYVLASKFVGDYTSSHTGFPG